MRIFYLLVSMSLFLSCYSNQSGDNTMPQPGETTISPEMEEDEVKEQARKRWIEQMHRAAPGTDWRQIDYQNRMRKHRKKAGQRTLDSRSGTEEIANGRIIGSWYEKGSRNQAGSVIATEYDPKEDIIFLVAAGGSLFKGPRDGSNWQIVNQDFQFEGRFLKFLSTDTSKRLVAMIDKTVHYSDDRGLTWVAAEGMDTYDNNWGRRKHARIIQRDSLQSIVLLVQEWDPEIWSSRVSIFLSNDLGEHFSRIYTFPTGDINQFALCKPENTDQLVLMETQKNGAAFYDIQAADSSVTRRVLSFDPELRTLDRAYLTGVMRDSQVVYFTYNDELTLFRANNGLANWDSTGVLPKNPWAVGLYPVPSKPNLMLLGEVECYRTSDDGAHWTKLNNWGAYYGDVENKLHADMMYFNEFETKDEEHFLLISNHGGLNVSYDYTATTPNIGLVGLNVSQYYSVRTDPNQRYFVYAGSQDQGFQRAISGNNAPVNFEQVISGDYGHIVFSGEGQHLWTVYPGGWVTYYDNPKTGGYSASWEVESEDESVWLPPLMSHPNPTKNAIYLAGGNMNGGSGSYLIELNSTGSNIQANQLNHDFKAASGGEISAMAHSPLELDRLYVTTTNGHFFYSTDGGQSWNKSSSGLPGAQYLYGTAIYASPMDEQTVYVGGSGYDNPAVYRSTDGGVTFTAIDEGLPPTLIYDLSGDPEGKYLFAGSSTGPYIRMIDEGQWYDMSGLTAPLQNYWSVEYLPQQKRVRFGTYGRGIWDFVIEEEVATDLPEDNVASFVVYPNPCSNYFTIEYPRKDPVQPPLRLYNQAGQLVRVWERLQSQYHVGQLATGSYYIQWLDKGKLVSKKVFINR